MHAVFFSLLRGADFNKGADTSQNKALTVGCRQVDLILEISNVCEVVLLETGQVGVQGGHVRGQAAQVGGQGGHVRAHTGQVSLVCLLQSGQGCVDTVHPCGEARDVGGSGCLERTHVSVETVDLGGEAGDLTLVSLLQDRQVGLQVRVFSFDGDDVRSE